MKANTPTKRGLELRGKRLKVTGAVLLVVVGVGGLWHYWTHPLRPWMVRWQVSHYLQQHSIIGDFAIPFPFPSKAELAKAPPKVKAKAKEAAAPKGKRTHKDFDTLAKEYIELKIATLALEREIPESEKAIEIWKPRLERFTTELAKTKAAGATNLTVREAQVASLRKRLEGFEKTAASRPALQAKQEALEPIAGDLWDFQRAWAAEWQPVEMAGNEALAKALAQLAADARLKIRQATSYEVIYKHIGQHLWVAERLLNGANPQYQRLGLSLALEASHYAMDEAQNGWLAARIVEGYVWPHRAVANDLNRRSPFNLENLLNECGNIFRGNDEFESTVRNYQILLASASSPQGADQARVQLSMAYEQNGDLKEALHYLRQVKDTNSFSWVLRRIPRLEQQLKLAR